MQLVPPKMASAANAAVHFSSSSSSIIFHISLIILFSLQSTQAAIKLPPGVHVPAVIVFGDSIVDSGNNNNNPFTEAKCNFLPYGRDFMGGNPTGRFSNGKVPSDFIVSILGIKELLPAYLDPSLKPEELLTGVNFASGGAGYDPVTTKIANVISLLDQLEMFKEYLGKVKAMVGDEKAQSIVSESVYLIVCGSNDITNTYFTSPFNKPEDFPAYADLMVHNAASFIQDLYGLGARRIGVFSAPPLGCLPSQRTIKGGKERKCVDELNKGAQTYNSKLTSMLDYLNKQQPQLRAVYIDTYDSLLYIIDNAASKGFEEATRGCCGTGKIETTLLCTELTPFTCKDATKFVFWDGFHPTEKAYEALVDIVTPSIERYISRFL